MRFKLFNRSKIPRKINLDDLARAFWQDHPGDDNCSKESYLNSSETATVWHNPDVNDFFLQYIRPFQKYMSPPVFRTIQDLLTEFEKMETCASVSEDDEETPKQYLALSSVSLLDHTLAVSREAIDLLRVKENDFQMNMGKTLIAALAHDVGKHPSAFIPHMPHSYKSAMWLQKRTSHLREREQIIEAVRLHHTDHVLKKTASSNPILPILIQADSNARQKELSNFNAEKQLKNQDQIRFSPSSENNLPNHTELVAQKSDAWFSKEVFIEHLKSNITCMGFDSFYFDNYVHIVPSIVECELNKLRQKHGLPEIKSRSDIQNMLALYMPEVRNEKCRLRFKSNHKPIKKWFFIFKASLLGTLEETALNNPRDQDGRWLKNIDRI